MFSAIPSSIAIWDLIRMSWIDFNVEGKQMLELKKTLTHLGSLMVLCAGDQHTVRRKRDRFYCR